MGLCIVWKLKVLEHVACASSLREANSFLTHCKGSHEQFPVNPKNVIHTKTAAKAVVIEALDKLRHARLGYQSAGSILKLRSSQRVFRSRQQEACSKRDPNELCDKGALGK
ncbi:hypothetical protein CCR75_006154 [Bremia lactucae]|uniref:Uncharacterized protein n=1 Tax=Bremia lactucae TaxID=4779 RepID=A0A976FP58_BRELC|nr:hypothetical protein CCR75_006154 [Bremia lactucae]